MSWNLKNLEPLLATAARLLAANGAAREVAILANGSARLEEVGYDNWDGGIYEYQLCIDVPTHLFAQFAEQVEVAETNIGEVVRVALRSYPDRQLRGVVIAPALTSSGDWRERARSWLAGEGVTNQGRVRSNNVAPKSCDGLLFRSEPEIHLYKALKSLGISFAPLPVFVRGGAQYRRIEPDFVIVHNGVIMVVEVDGDTVHQESPAEAHARTTMLAYEGVHIERVNASECASLEIAAGCARRLLQVAEKLKLAHA
jgi:hypothetical protein